MAMGINKETLKTVSVNFKQPNQVTTAGTNTAATIQKQPLLHFKESGDDLLTKNLRHQYIYGKQSLEVEYYKTIAADTNEMLKELGCNYKVAPSQVASVAQNYNNVIAPGMQQVADGAVAANVQDPKGPFANLFLD